MKSQWVRQVRRQVVDKDEDETVIPGAGGNMIGDRVNGWHLGHPPLICLLCGPAGGAEGAGGDGLEAGLGCTTVVRRQPWRLSSRRSWWGGASWRRGRSGGSFYRLCTEGDRETDARRRRKTRHEGRIDKASSPPPSRPSPHFPKQSFCQAAPLPPPLSPLACRSCGSTRYTSCTGGHLRSKNWQTAQVWGEQRAALHGERSTYVAWR